MIEEFESSQGTSFRHFCCHPLAEIFHNPTNSCLFQSNSVYLISLFDVSCMILMLWKQAIVASLSFHFCVQGMTGKFTLQKNSNLANTQKVPSWMNHPNTPIQVVLLSVCIIGFAASSSVCCFNYAYFFVIPNVLQYIFILFYLEMAV